MYYLDDFLFMSMSGDQYKVCTGNGTPGFHTMGIPVVVNKSERPTAQLVFLGIVSCLICC